MRQTANGYYFIRETTLMMLQRVGAMIALSLLAMGSAALLAPPARAVEHAHVCRYCRGDAVLPQAPDAMIPGARKYAPDRQVDVLHIKLDVTPNFKKNTVAGTAILRFAPIAKPLKSLRLDAVNLDVSAVRSSHKVGDHSSDDASLTIVFDKPVPVDEEASIEIDYSAEPTQGLYFRTPAMGFPDKDTHCWTQGEPHEARHWFPCFDYPNERSSTEIICRIPKEMTVVSNGRKIAESVDEDAGLKAVHWLQEKSHVSYLICMVAGNLVKLEDEHRDVPLGFYTQPSKAEHAANAFRDTADIMAFYEKEIGVPFPWDKYDQVTCADYHWGGMENTTITTLTQRTIYSDETENVTSGRSRSLDAHEMAHQWFGDYVTCKDWSHLWLNEGFATYYALLYEGHKMGRDAMLYGLYLDARDDIFPQDSDKRPICYREYKEPGEQFDFRNYPKASWVLHMLRSQVGEDLYREAIHNYLQRHALSDVETEDLREAFEELSGKPLDKFFDQWVYHGGQPELTVKYRWLAEEKTAHVSVAQTQATGDDVLLFELATKLRFIVDGKSIDEDVKINDRQHDFYVRLPAEPEVVRFDPEYTLLAKVKFDLSEKQLKAQLKAESDMIGRLLACEGLAKRKTKASVKALQHALENDDFFGVREAAATALRQIRIDEAVNALVESSDQDDARVRYRVIAELGKCYRDEARKKLLATVDAEKNPAIVASAIRGLANFQGKATTDAVREALASQTHNNEPAAAAFEAIGTLDARGLADDLMKTIKDREEEIHPLDLATGMNSLAKISPRGKRRAEAYEFLTQYLNHPRQTLRVLAINALGALREPRARELLEPIAADDGNATLARAAKAALDQLDKETQLVPAEVGKLRDEVRDLRESQEKLEKALDALKAKAAAKEDDAKDAEAEEDEAKEAEAEEDDANDDEST